MQGFWVLFITTASGCLVGWFIYQVLKKHTLGELWGAIIVGVIGAFIGHYLLAGPIKVVGDFIADYVIKKFLVNCFETEINLLAILTGAFLLVWVLSKVSPGTHKSRLR